MDVRRWDSLEKIPAYYSTTASPFAVNRFFNAPAWFQILSQTVFGPDQNLCFYGFEERGEPLFILPTYTIGSVAFPPRGPELG